MKKMIIILACVLSCFILFTGCTNQKGNDDQESNVNSGVEVDMTDEANSSDEPANSDPLPDEVGNTDEPASSDSQSDDFTYNPKNPENSDGIVVRPKE